MKNRFSGFWKTFWKKGDFFTRLSLVVMGSGCFRFGQIVKGLLYLGAEALYFWFFFGFGWKYLSHFNTLGRKYAAAGLGRGQPDLPAGARRQFHAHPALQRADAGRDRHFSLCVVSEPEKHGQASPPPGGRQARSILPGGRKDPAGRAFPRDAAGCAHDDAASFYRPAHRLSWC